MKTGIINNGEILIGDATCNMKTGIPNTNNSNTNKTNHKTIKKEDFLKILEDSKVELISMPDGCFQIEPNENGISTFYFYSTPKSQFNVPYNPYKVFEHF